ncbi:MAG TPA: efflux RND transporter permease subunit, partial [Lacipirellulaceae bacterium]|nr:efflux RND transporter permease subunit [Lacipirellulaceae bacterium]
EADGAKLKTFGLRRLAVNDFVAAAMQGRTVSQVLDGRRTFDLVVRLDDPFRENLEAVRRLVLESPSGPVKLEDVARIYAATGPHTINRDQLSRRVVVQCNVSGRGLVDVVEDIRRRLEPIEAALPPGYFLRYGGQFESQQSAARTMGLLAGASLAGMFLALYALFQSANLALQVLAAIPMAIIGGVLALAVTGQTLTVAAMV